MGTGGPERPAAESGDTIPRNAAFALAAQLTTATFTAVLTLILVRVLGPAEFGVFALALGVTAVVLLPSDFGISESTARFVAEHRDDSGAVRGVLRLAIRLKLLVGLIAASALVALAGPIAAVYGSPELAWPVRAGGVALFMQGLMQFGTATFTALGRLSVNFRVVLSESATEFTASLATVLLIGGAAAAMWGRAIGYALGALLALLAIARLTGWSPRGTGERSPVRGRAVFGYAGALLIVDGAFALFTQIDILLIGLLLGTTATGLYSAPLRLTPLLAYPGLALARAVAPGAARRGDRTSDPSALQRSIRLLLLVQSALLAAIAVWAEPITDLALGPGYEQSADVLRALAPFIFLSGIAPLVSLAINYAGEARRRIPIAVATLLLNVAIDLVLIPRIGIVGAAVGTGVAYALYVGAHLRLCRILLGVRLAPLATTLARGLVAAALLAALLGVIGVEDLGPADWLIGAVAGPLVFVAVLLVTREVSTGELSAGGRRAWGVLRSLRPGG